MKYSQAQKVSIINAIRREIVYNSHRIYDFENDEANYDVIRNIYESHTDIEMIEQARKATSLHDSILEKNIIHVFDVHCFNIFESAIREAVEDQRVIFINN